MLLRKILKLPSKQYSILHHIRLPTMHCFALIIMALSIAFADDSAPNLFEPEADISPALKSNPSHNSASSIATPDFGNIPPADSIVTPYSTGIFEVSTSNPQDLEATSSEHREELIGDSNSAATMDVLNSECSVDSIQTNGKFRRQQQLCRPQRAKNGLGINGADQDGGDNSQAQSDMEDTAYAREHVGEDIDAKRICDSVNDRRKLPFCCRGDTWVSMGASLIGDCVGYIEGRPRCLGYRQRYCCSKYMIDVDWSIIGVNCRSMFAHL